MSGIVTPACGLCGAAAPVGTSLTVVENPNRGTLTVACWECRTKREEDGRARRFASNHRYGQRTPTAKDAPPTIPCSKCRARPATGYLQTPSFYQINPHLMPAECNRVQVVCDACNKPGVLC
jgi:hypothetical protein